MKTISYYLIVLFAWQSVTAQVSNDDKLNKAYNFWKKITSANIKSQQRAPQNLMEALDSINYDNLYMERFTYDTQGNQLSYDFIEYDNGTIDFGDRTEYSYNAQNYLIQIVNKEWTNNTWIEMGKSDLNYDNQNRLSELLSYTYNNSAWVLYGKIEYAYNANNQLVSYTFSDFDNSNWVFNSKRELSYSASGKISEIINFSWNGNAWETENKAIFEYDTSDRLILYAIWKYINASWEPVNKNEFEYNISGELVKIYEADWDSNSQSWFFFSRKSFVYDTNNALVEIFDESNNNSNWELNGKQVFTYDYNYTSNSLLLPDFYILQNLTGVYRPHIMIELPLYFRYKLTQLEYMIYNSGTWDIYKTLDLYYSTKDINAEAEIVLDDVSVVPNPAKEYIQIVNSEQLNQAELSIFDMQGKKVFQGTATGNIDVSGLSKGLYIYKIKAFEGVKTGKLIIQ